MNLTLNIPDSLKQQYIERRRVDVDKLTAALDQGDYAVVSRAGHQLKGNAATFGFDELEPIGAALEEAGDAADAVSAQKALASFKAWVSSRVS